MVILLILAAVVIGTIAADNEMKKCQGRYQRPSIKTVEVKQNGN